MHSGGWGLGEGWCGVSPTVFLVVEEASFLASLSECGACAFLVTGVLANGEVLALRRWFPVVEEVSLPAYFPDSWRVPSRMVDLQSGQGSKL